MLRRVGYAVVLWAMAYVLAVPLLPLNDADPLAFKAVMVCISAIVGAALTAYYLLSVARDFLREALLLAVP